MIQAPIPPHRTPSDSWPRTTIVGLLLALLAGAGLLCSCAATRGATGATSAGAAPAPSPTDTALAVTLLATTDLHGALVDGGTERETSRRLGGAAVVSAWKRKLAARAPERTFLLDGGDMMQGSPVSNLVYGRSVIEVMNADQVDAAALGNHEFDWGIDTLAARIAQARFPVLAANVFEKATGARPAWIRPYALVTRGGVTVGVIGAATPETPTATAPRNVASLRFDDPVPAINALVPEIRARGADVVVVLAHIGGAVETDGGPRGEIFDLARGVRGVDAVFGGHTHTFVATRVDGRPVVVAGSNGRAVGEVRLVVNRVARTVRVEREALHRTYPDSVAVAERDTIAAIVARYDAAVAPIMGRVLGRAAAAITRAGPAMGNFVADAMRAAARADVGFTNAGGLRRDLDAGPVTLGLVYELMPFDNALVTLSLTGAQVKSVLEEQPGRVCLSGIRARYDPARPQGDRVTDLVHDGGTPVDPAASYMVVTNDFMVQGGSGFTTFAKATNVVNTGRLVRDELVSAIEAATAAGRAVEPDTTERLAGRRQRGAR